MTLTTLTLALALAAASLNAQQPLPGYTPTNSARERAAEADALTHPSPASASAHSRELSKQTHVAGTPAQATTRDYVLKQMAQWGLDTSSRRYDVWMPHATAVHVARVSPQPKELAPAEPPVVGHPTPS